MCPPEGVDCITLLIDTVCPRTNSISLKSETCRKFEKKKTVLGSEGLSLEIKKKTVLGSEELSLEILLQSMKMAGACLGFQN